MPSVEVEIEVYCICGNGICNNTNVGRTKGRGQQYFEVSPCEKCLEKAKEEGRDKGYYEGEEYGIKIAEEKAAEIIEKLEAKINELESHRKEKQE